MAKRKGRIPAEQRLGKMMMIRADASLHARLASVAAAEERPMSWVIRRAVMEYVVRAEDKLAADAARED